MRLPVPLFLQQQHQADREDGVDAGKLWRAARRVGGFVFHRFPTIERLARVSEQEFRDAGFGYRSALGAFLRVASCICVLCYKHQLLCLFYSALLVKFSLVSSISKLVWVEDQRLSCSVANSSLL
jgi:hypothetical protein